MNVKLKVKHSNNVSYAKSKKLDKEKEKMYIRYVNKW